MREQRMFGPGLYPGDEAVKATGIDSVLPRDDFKAMLEALGRENRVIYTPFRPEVLGSASSSDRARLARNTKNDPWDGRISREEQFRARLKEYAPNSEIKDLDPTLDTLRGTKDAREIANIREAAHIAGLGIMEAMRDARPGMYEYELQADCGLILRSEERVQGDPPGPGGPPYNLCRISRGPINSSTLRHVFPGAPSTLSSECQLVSQGRAWLWRGTACHGLGVTAARLQPFSRTHIGDSFILRTSAC
jgi:hypothetical protein